MAAIYGLPSEHLSSPRRTPTSIDPSVAARRSSMSLSPSTSQASPLFAEHPAPPLKRRRVTRASVAAAAAAGVSRTVSSPASGYPLEDIDEHLTAPPSSPATREHKDPTEEIPKHVMDIYVTFSGLASWHDADNRPVCGFCSYVLSTPSLPPKNN